MVLTVVFLIYNTVNLSRSLQFTLKNITSESILTVGLLKSSKNGFKSLLTKGLCQAFCLFIEYINKTLIMKLHCQNQAKLLI